MNILLWSLIILFFIFSFAGILFPILPSILFLWGGFLIYHFFINGEALNALFWWGLGGVTLFLLIADYVIGAYFVKKFGGSPWSMVASIAGALLFPWFMGPIGIIVGPFLAIFLVELILGKGEGHSFRVAFGSFLSFLSSGFVKMLLQLAMILWFFWII